MPGQLVSPVDLCMATPTLACNCHTPSWPGGHGSPATTRCEWPNCLNPSFICSTTSSPTCHHCQHTQPPWSGSAKPPATQTHGHGCEQGSIREAARVWHKGCEGQAGAW